MGTKRKDTLVCANRGAVHGLVIRERITAPRSDYNLGICWSCNAVLTSADLEAGRCTNCEPEVEDDEGEAEFEEWLGRMLREDKNDR